MMADYFQQLCGGCKSVPGTMDCGNCKREKYCSKSCQRSQWKTKHRPICAFLATLPPEEPLHMLDLDTEKGELRDFDSVLDFAARRLGPTLKHFKAWVPQELILVENVGVSSFAPSAVKFTADNLEKFLRSCSGLQSFNLGIDECCQSFARIATNSGRSFLHLSPSFATLETFSVTNVPFLDRQDLISLINGCSNNLKTLELRDVTFGRRESEQWSYETTGVVLQAVSGCTKLVTLTITSYCTIRDQNLESLLARLTNLRCLTVTGSFGSRSDRVEVGKLTDTGVDVIVRCCPDLQLLDLNHNESITTKGVATILRGCPRMRELSVCGARLQVQDLTQLLPLSPMLLLLRFDSGSFHFGSPNDIQHVRQALTASGGRTLLTHFYKGLLEPPGLSEEHKQQQLQSKALLKQAGDRTLDPSVHNEYEALD